jgi:hypothetical protein
VLTIWVCNFFIERDRERERERERKRERGRERKRERGRRREREREGEEERERGTESWAKHASDPQSYTSQTYIGGMLRSIFWLALLAKGGGGVSIRMLQWLNEAI